MKPTEYLSVLFVVSALVSSGSVRASQAAVQPDASKLGTASDQSAPAKKATRLQLELVGTEPVPVTGKEYWTVIFDFLKPEVTTGTNSHVGFSFSEDGLKWPTRNAQLIDLEQGLPAGTNAWWRAIRVPHQLIDEGNGLFTCFFSAYDKQGEFESIGKATFRVKEMFE